MKGSKAGLKQAQSGTPVSEKNTPSKKDNKSNKKGSLTAAMGLPHVDSGTYEGSHHDYMDDYRESNRRGISAEDYEDSARDRIKDKAGERKMREKEASKSAIKNEPGYKPGMSAHANRPKASHGFGHTGSQKQGHLRTSGHSGAHQIGKK